MAGRVVVVGLGPAGVDHLLPAARAALERLDVRYVRTRRHPTVVQLEADGITFESFDHLYDVATDLDAAYRTMVATLLDGLAKYGEIAYAVPGNPAVAERTVALLHEASGRGELAVEMVAGLSFADLAWVRVGVDPMDTQARVVDGRDIERAELAGPLLIAQCDSRFVLSDVKLSLLEHLDPATPITVLQRLGLSDERVITVALEELDRGVEPDHLTSLFVNTGGVTAAVDITRLLRLAKRLRDPGGCPWDAEQTHRSLTRYLLEEAYEVVEAVEAIATSPASALDPSAVPSADPSAAHPGTPGSSAQQRAALADELGDLLYQVVFHAVIAEETGEFTMADIARGIHDKLVRRHPHVFGAVDAATSGDVMRNWEQIKKEEKGTSSIVAGITPGLPALLYTHKLFRKAASVGLDPGNRAEALDRIEAAVNRLRAGSSTTADSGEHEHESDVEIERDLAVLLAAAVVLARAGGVDAESALRGWAARYRGRFEAMERLAIGRGLDLAALEPPAVAALWLEAAGA